MWQARPIETSAKQNLIQALAALENRKSQKIETYIRGNSLQRTISDFAEKYEIHTISLVEEPKGTFDWLMIFAKPNKLFVYCKSWVNKSAELRKLIEKLEKLK